MPAFFQYARNITYYLLFAALLGMAAPNDKYKKYIALVSGFILICLILQPLKPLLSGGIPVTELFARIVPVPQAAAAESGEGASFETTYEQWRYETLKSAFEEQLDTQLSELLSHNGYELEEAEYECADDFSRIQRISVTVTAKPDTETRKPFIRIEPVRISAGEGDESDESDAVKKVISDFYGLPSEHIHVRVRT